MLCSLRTSQTNCPTQNGSADGPCFYDFEASIWKRKISNRQEMKKWTIERETLPPKQQQQQQLQKHLIKKCCFLKKIIRWRIHQHTPASHTGGVPVMWNPILHVHISAGSCPSRAMCMQMVSFPSHSTSLPAMVHGLPRAIAETVLKTRSTTTFYNNYH